MNFVVSAALALLYIVALPTEVEAKKSAGRSPAQVTGAKLERPVTIRWERTAIDGIVEHVTVSLTNKRALLVRNTSVFTRVGRSPVVLGLSVASADERTRSWASYANVLARRYAQSAVKKNNLSREVANLKPAAPVSRHKPRVYINGVLFAEDATRVPGLWSMLQEVQNWVGWTPKDEVSVIGPRFQNTAPIVRVVSSTRRRATEPVTRCQPLGENALRCNVQGYGLAYVLR